MITKLQITGKLHYHRKCDFQLSKRKLGYRTLLPLTAPICQFWPDPGYAHTGLEFGIRGFICGGGQGGQLPTPTP